MELGREYNRDGRPDERRRGTDIHTKNEQGDEVPRTAEQTVHQQHKEGSNGVQQSEQKLFDVRELQEMRRVHIGNNAPSQQYR